ncbi:hypothetical protein AQUCO_02100180v1 [Aquilegia coerulea]|uniref:2-C-methyl-D-erythritol 4-phosphate cytidylyltransferase, chloroplastic n=1 Tax=Aquilegia coerulea TaxID=218851 RepID=A0A2G5DF46_AQUCA|nr:hypothetical protein AQUCO_02100180v1 [Aquilegia coerulea]
MDIALSTYSAPPALHLSEFHGIHMPKSSSLSLLYNNKSKSKSKSKSNLSSTMFPLPQTFPVSRSRKLDVCCSATISSSSAPEQTKTIRNVKEKSVSVVLLAGGQGKRMGASMPKQYLPLLGQPIALYSFYTFSRMMEVKEIIVVCDPSYKDIFEDAREKIDVDLKFALPGKERQDSVYNGFQAIDAKSELVCIHDSARPLVSTEDIEKVLNDGWLNGAAVLGVPSKATIKEANSDSFVVRTLDRKTLWEMQTPQIIKPELLRKGFELVNRP